jgi:hypothetical protein
MLEAHSIAATSATLRRLLIDGIPKQDALLAQIDVTSLPPDKVNANVDRATLNVFLYRVATPSTLRNSLPPRSGMTGSAPPQNGLALHYLLTAYGRVDQEQGDISHRVLGAAMRVLHDAAIVNTGDLDAMRPLHASLSAPHMLRIVPSDATVEELSTLWSLFQTSYRLSVTYEVLVLSASEPRDAAPVVGTTAARTHEPFGAAVQALALDASAADAMRQLKSALDAADKTMTLSALFAGGSANVMLRAAQLLASESGRALHRIDLASVADTYIGETEKNLRRLFDEAARAGAILFFDEADALFGKRSEVRDSHDRYANLEVSYLLQRLEAYPGLVIISTARKTALDAAFVRRLRFVVDFPSDAKD